MSKKHIKLIMELLFIFILPLVFICFTSKIQIEREFTYDNQGNYETSADTKQLSFDNSIIKYTKLDFKKQEFTTIINGTYYIPLNNSNYGINDNTYLYIYNNDNHNSDITYIYIILSTNKLRLKVDNDTYNYDMQEQVVINGIIYNKYVINDTITIHNNLIIYNYGYYNYLTVNTIWGNIKQLLIDNLDLNDNVLLDIVLCYTILWVVMWIIWHLFYGFLELLIHIVPRKWEADY